MAATINGTQARVQRPRSPNNPARFQDVFGAELVEISSRREAMGQSAPILTEDLRGLALSGGGIRSATYSLGVLQKLSEYGLLEKFDYLSTVSGGGFIGGWWSAWLSRLRPASQLFPPPEQIEPAREDAYRDRPSTNNTDSSISAGTDPIHHVRLFSNYLTPRKGTLSLDTWRAITVGFRNLIATWLILFPLFMAVALLAQLYFVHLQPLFFNARVPIKGDEISERIRLMLVPLIFLGGLFVTTVFAWIVNTWDSQPRGNWAIRLFSMVAGFTVGALAVGVAAYEFLHPWQTDPFASPRIAVVAAILWSAVAILVLLWCYWHAITRRLSKIALRIANLRQQSQPPAVAGCTPEEMATRLTQASEIILVIVVGLSITLGFFGFVQELWIALSSAMENWIVRTGGWLAALASLASIAFTLWKALPTGGGDLRGQQRRTSASQLVFAIAPPIALLIIATLAAEASDRSIDYMLTRPAETQWFFWAAVAFVSLSLLCLFWEIGHELSEPDKLQWILGILYAAFLAGLLWGWRDGLMTQPAEHHLFLAFSGLAFLCGWAGTFGWYVDPNALSLHGFYKARLTRAYLGASNLARQKSRSPITDAVNGDDLLLSELRNCELGAPYHLINTTLNLVGGHDLATAQRLAEPFLLSKCFCGNVSGYRPTESYMYGRLTLGTAVAVSGAAVSPNMGSMTMSSSLAMLMTFFNIRLGYWAPTPDHASWQSPQARHWPWYTLRELLSQTTKQAKYCYLSDGGHFDNTGVYSLIQRGCKSIVMVDCGADPRPCFEDLGGLVRRCRIDFGAEINIDITNLTDSESDIPITRFLIGTITYSETHLKLLGQMGKDRTGTLILIKPSLTLEEATGSRSLGMPLAATDLRQFRITHSDYPQISTADQWFGEAQFESYRRLGEISVEAVIGDSISRALRVFGSGTSDARMSAPPPGPNGDARPLNL